MRREAAWLSQGIVESAFEAYSQVLVDCQKETSQLQTTPFMRGESQQSHCYRY